jgi:hypothetical protein
LGELRRASALEAAGGQPGHDVPLEGKEGHDGRDRGDGQRGDATSATQFARGCGVEVGGSQLTEMVTGAVELAFASDEVLIGESLEGELLLLQAVAVAATARAASTAAIAFSRREGLMGSVPPDRGMARQISLSSIEFEKNQ